MADAEALIASCTPDEWHVSRPDAGWTVAAKADHVAIGLNLERDWIMKVAFAEPMVPLAMDAAPSASSTATLRRSTGRRSYGRSIPR
jgi:hypothetical protein